MKRSQSLTLAVLALAGLLGGGAARAAIFTVGGDPACTHETAQQGIDAAEAAAGADTVRLTRSLTYTAQNLVINTGQHLNLVGGFADCTAAGDGVKTTVSGAGGATEPVLRITGATGSIIKLRHLTISGGDEDGGGHGGGIRYLGNGILELIESTVTNNLAGYGGGIYAEGTGTDAELTISNDVVVSSNTARYSGGGVYADKIEMSMRAPNSILFANTALGLDGSGYGGGLVILGHDLSSYAYIGSGVSGLGAIYGNEARYGGGVAVVADDPGDTSRESMLQLYTTDAARPASIRGNFASVAGGGIFVRSHEGGVVDGTFAKAELYNASLVDNASPAGAAVYIAASADPWIDYSSRGYIRFNVEQTWPAAAVRCSTGSFCGEISGNVTEDAGGVDSEGAILQLEKLADLALNSPSVADGAVHAGMLVRGNQGGRLLDVGDNDEDEAIVLRNVVIVDNAFTQQLVRTPGSGYLNLGDLTIANNQIGADPVIASGGHDLWFARSIVWQPGRTTLARSGGALMVAQVIASEVTSLVAGPEAIVARPRFVDPARGDYELRAASPAVDAAVPMAGDDVDATRRPRDIDIAVVANSRGPRDIGALERPALQPLVLNGNFDQDLNLWPAATVGSTQWSNENGFGTLSSGSAWVHMDPAPQVNVYGLSHCVHLPGPGTYALNGYGKSAGFTITSRDQLFLQWQYRSDGGEACNAGAPIGEGTHFLTSSSSWTRAATPTFITVSEAEWTHNSSINVTLMVRDTSVTAPASVSGYFDGISLTLDSNAMPGALLKDGFEDL